MCQECDVKLQLFQYLCPFLVFGIHLSYFILAFSMAIKYHLYYENNFVNGVMNAAIWALFTYRAYN